ncbi:hypothetical protein ACPCHU_28385 [Bacillus bombysepticus]
MRHTRSVQVRKANPQRTVFGNIPIWQMRENTAEIDKTFKWDRKMGRVQWSFKTGRTKTTMFALLKYPTVPRWFKVKPSRKGGNRIERTERT